MWDLIVSVPGHCLSFYFELKSQKAEVINLKSEVGSKKR